MRLVNNVTVTNPETGGRETFGPTDRVPDWARELITNPSAWTNGEPLRSTASFDDWTEPAVELDLTSQTHKKLLRAAERCGIEIHKSAGKDIIADAIMTFLFDEEGAETIMAEAPERTQTGETPLPVPVPVE